MIKKKEELKRKVYEAKEAIEGYIEENPKRCVAGAAIGGLIIGALVSCLICKRK